MAAAQAGDGVDVTIVSIDTTSELREQLDTLAAAAGPGRGQVVEATELGEVAQRFEAASRAIAQQIVVTAPVTEDLFGRPISISVSALADDGSEIEASATYLMPPAPVHATSHRGAELRTASQWRHRPIRSARRSFP